MIDEEGEDYLNVTALNTNKYIYNINNKYNFFYPIFFKKYQI
jgi:hypothetical protein